MSCRIERVPDYLKRTRDPDECVILVDRLWPRGVRKEILDIDRWMKEIGPSHSLRQWFGHDRSKWEEFSRRFRNELEVDPEKSKLLQELQRYAKNQALTLLFNARDPECNQARVIQMLIA